MAGVFKRSPYFVVVMAAAVMFVAGFLLSPGVTQGQETDVSVPAATTPASSESAPPQAPLDEGPSASTAGETNALPSAGNGGYLQAAKTNALTVGVLGLALIGLGASIGAYSLRTNRR